jgi:hypothetical protein
MISVVWFLVSERAECNGCDIRRTDERDLAIAARRVYLALASNYETLSPL